MKTSSLLKGAATVTAIAVMAGSGAMLAKSFASTAEIQDYVKSLVLKALRKASTNMTMVITDEQVFQDAMVYMSTRISPSSNRVRVVKTAEDKDIRFVHARDNVFTDTFEGVKLSWILRSLSM